MGVAPRRAALFGRYELLCVLATGGMAAVHLARAAGIGGFEKLLVIKRILPHAAHDRGFIEMFLDEARLAATLAHANVAQVFDAGAVDGDVYLAMEFLHGHDVRSIAKAFTSAIPLDAAIAIALGVCAGLHHAHERRGPDGKLLELVHRDISPSNVVVTFDGSIKVIDFGIAKASARLGVETTTGVVKGKPGYMSPEQCLGDRELDRRSDVFCVGILLYELTVGQRLFPASTTEYAQLHAIVEGAIAAPSTIVPGYPRELERIVMTALDRDVDRRYQTAEALQRDLAAFARTAHLDVTPSRMAAFMAETFRDELDAWHAAQRAGTSLADHIVSRGEAERHSLGRLTTREGDVTATASATADSPYAQTEVADRAAPTSRGDRTPASSERETVRDDPRPRGAPARAEGRRSRAPIVVAIAALVATAGAVTAWQLRARDERVATPIAATRPQPPPADARVDGAERPIDASAAPADAAKAISHHDHDGKHGSGTGSAQAPEPEPADAATCRCISPIHHGPRDEWLCHKKLAPSCRCRTSHGTGEDVCTVPFEKCYGKNCDFSQIKMCASPTPTVTGEPGAACRGYAWDPKAYESVEATDAALHCYFCMTIPFTDAQRAAQYSYRGKPGESCSGFVTETGEHYDSTLTCDPAK